METLPLDAAQVIRPATTLLNQPYTVTAGSERQCLDLYVPAGAGSLPVAIWIHGGGWHSCDRGVAAVASQFTDRGFALASIGYRLTSGGTPFPAQIEDCTMGINWLARNAGTFGLDRGRFCLFGHSAGAHLSALLVVTQGRKKFTLALEPELRFRAAALWSGPLDLSRVRGEWPRETFPWNADDNYCRTFFPGGAYDEEVALWASPATYVSHALALPPMLIVHGDRDDLVPFSQALTFAKAAGAAGSDVTFRQELGKGHGMPEEIWSEAIEYFQNACSVPDYSRVSR